MVASSDWNRLHPASILVNLIPTAWRALRSMWPFLAAVFVGSTQQRFGLLDSIFLWMIFGLPIWRTFIHWATLRYRVEGGRLEIQTGLLHRQERVILPERIQNVERVQNIFHRMSGLVEVRIETASGNEVEGELSALSEQAATELMAALNTDRARSEPTEKDLAPVLENGPVDLLKFSLTAGRFGLAIVGMGLLYDYVLTDPRVAQAGAKSLGYLGSTALLLVFVGGAWLFSAGSSLLRHWGFVLYHPPGRLIAEAGLLTRRRVELRSDKVQLISLQEPLLRRLLGFGTLHIETAAARKDAGGTLRAEAVIPVVPVDQQGELIRHALPTHPLSYGDLLLSPPHPRALTRALLRALIWSGVLVGIAAVIFGWYGAIALFVSPFFLFDAWFDHRYQGYQINTHHVISRTGWWRRTTRIITRNKLQSAQLEQGILLRNWGLAILRVRVAGSSISLPILEFNHALDLLLELSRPQESRGEDQPANQSAPVRPEDHSRDILESHDNECEPEQPTEPALPAGIEPGPKNKGDSFEQEDELMANPEPREDRSTH